MIDEVIVKFNFDVIVIIDGVKVEVVEKCDGWNEINVVKYY